MAVGDHALIARYPGDANVNAGVSSTLTQTVTIATTNDTLFDSAAAENFTVTLGSASLGGGITAGTATGVINDNETAPSFSVSAAAPVTEGSGVVFTVTRNRDADQSQTVDFATSNVRGAGVPLYIGGAMVLGNYPVGPLGGVAFNLTMLSYNHSLDMGLNVDTAAVTDPELLRRCIEDSMRQLITASRPTTTAVGEKPKFRLRWWKRR